MVTTTGTAAIIIPQHHPRKEERQIIEVIGGHGRIGSQFMRLLRTHRHRNDSTTTLTTNSTSCIDNVVAVAVPHGICPGSLSSTISNPNHNTTNTTNNNPIFVCSPSTSWSTIYETTLPSSQRSDLVFVGNGLLPANIPLHLCDAYPTSNVTAAAAMTTVVIPHYAILNVGDRPTVNEDAPPTYIAGKHSQMVERMLRNDGISNIQRYDYITPDVIAYMIQKVLWTSCLWLLCHTLNGPSNPLTVSQVHTHHNSTFVALVTELWPSVQLVYNYELNRIVPTVTSSSTNDNNNSTETVPTIMTMSKVIQYMEQYSFSIPNAIPSKSLAMKEIDCRNKVFASHCGGHRNKHESRPPPPQKQQQPIHYQLLQQLLGTERTNHLFHQTQSQPRQQQYDIVDVRCLIGMAVYGQRRNRIETTTTTTTTATSNSDRNLLQPLPPRNKKVLIVGAGILGSSVAFNLARLQQQNRVHWQQQQQELSQPIDITVIDSHCSDINDTNNTTKASFGWINANFMKQPISYQNFNSLGIHAWYNDPILSSLPHWNGSIIRTNSLLNDDVTVGYYNQSIGPLSNSELKELEPNIRFTNDDNKTSSVYYFPQEGLVDPCDVVRTMRNEAMKQGVSFLWNCTMQQIVAVGTEYSSSISKNRTEYICTVARENKDGSIPIMSTIDADVIVIAAGVGSSNISLGGLPMQQPTDCSGGTIHFIKNSFAEQSENNNTLKRIIVDMVKETHTLQRRNGTVVVGGGRPLHVGGTHVDTATDMKLFERTNGPKNEMSSVLLSNHSAMENKTLATEIQNLIPNILGTMTIDQTLLAARPIPIDGLPSIGYYPSPIHGSGMYSLVSHSGITLAPLLGALAAIEVMDPNLALDILEAYRPERLFVQHL